MASEKQACYTSVVLQGAGVGGKNVLLLSKPESSGHSSLSFPPENMVGTWFNGKANSVLSFPSLPCLSSDQTTIGHANYKE